MDPKTKKEREQEEERFAEILNEIETMQVSRFQDALDKYRIDHGHDTVQDLMSDLANAMVKAREGRHDERVKEQEEKLVEGVKAFEARLDAKIDALLNKPRMSPEEIAEIEAMEAMCAEIDFSRHHEALKSMTLELLNKLKAL